MAPWAEVGLVTMDQQRSREIMSSCVVLPFIHSVEDRRSNQFTDYRFAGSALGPGSPVQFPDSQIPVGRLLGGVLRGGNALSLQIPECKLQVRVEEEMRGQQITDSRFQRGLQASRCRRDNVEGQITEETTGG